jgi:pimeloyl-ACP methyl ester carboxylesterase
MPGAWARKCGSDTGAIVFVHGVMSSDKCWRHANGTFWPEIVVHDQDLELLGVYYFNYRTGPFSGSYRLGDAVDDLKEHLRLDGVLNASHIIFVCHSMGGILVRKYLVERATDLIERKISVSLFLIASPSLGSQYANWLSPIAKFVGHSQADALRIGQNNAWLSDLDKEFLNLKENRRLQLSGKELVEDTFIVFKKFFRNQVVEPFSGARYFGEPFKVPNSDHFSIAKIDGSTAIQHRLLRQFILDQMEPKPSDSSASKDHPATNVTAHWWIYGLVGTSAKNTLTSVGVFRLSQSHNRAVIEDGQVFRFDLDNNTTTIARGEWHSKEFLITDTDINFICVMNRRSIPRRTKHDGPAEYESVVTLRRDAAKPFAGDQRWSGNFHDLQERRQVTGIMICERLPEKHVSPEGVHEL